MFKSTKFCIIGPILEISNIGTAKKSSPEGTMVHTIKFAIMVLHKITMCNTVNKWTTILLQLWSVDIDPTAALNSNGT